MPRKYQIEVTCLDCGHQHFVNRHEFGRAARVRCIMCGGPVEPSKMGRQKLVAGQDAASQQHAVMRQKKQPGSP